MESESESESEMSYFERDQLPLVVACSSGDADALRRALAAGQDPETPDGRGWPPIMQVCSIGDHSYMVSMLLAAGADPNGTQRLSGFANLQMAVCHGRLECTALLLSAGASVQEREIYNTIFDYTYAQTPAEGMSNCRCRRTLPMLLRAGSPIPRLTYYTKQSPTRTLTLKWFCYEDIPYNVRNYQILCEYRSKVVAAGSWAAYERAHRTRLAKVLAPKFPQIPAEIVPTIVAFAFHTGWY